MADNHKPVKRSPQLAPLSREHHEDLLFVWKMRQGLATNIESSRMIAFTQWFWQQHLQHHFKKEETAIPLVLGASHPLLLQMQSEHNAIKTLIDESIEHGDLKKLETLAQLLNDHIRFEERRLFGKVENAASPAQLERLSEQLKHEDNDAVWKDEFRLRAY